MRVAANVGVADEIELIDDVIEHLQYLEIDHIVITDVRSRDGTRERLRDHSAAGTIDLIEVDGDTPEAFHYANRMLRHTRRLYAPDWIVFGDADEFLVPRDGDLRRVLAETTHDVLVVPRLNIVPHHHSQWAVGKLRPPGYSTLDLVVDPIPDLRIHLQQNPSTPWILGRVQPKIIARSRCVDSIVIGAHNVQQSTQRISRFRSPDLVIAHAAITSEPRFLRKLRNLRDVFDHADHEFTEQMAWHWRRWLEIEHCGEGSSEYHHNVFDKEQLALLREQGRVATACQWFERQPVTPVLP